MSKNIKRKIIKKIQGFSLIELIVAIAVFSILASGVVYVFTTSYKNFFGVGDKQVIVQFAQEGMEATRSIRDNGWQTIVNVADGSPRGVQKNNGLWEFSGSNNTLGDLTRVIVVSDVMRNSSGSIVASGGTDDPDTKKVMVTVSGTGIADYVLTTFYTNWSAKTWEQTDWSGTVASEFWASMITASSSYSNVGTSTVGQLSLALQDASNGVYGAWADFTSDVSQNITGSWPVPRDIELSPDGEVLYIAGGNQGTGLTALDIRNVRESRMNLLWYLFLDEDIYSLEINSNGKYAYVGSGDCDEGARFIEVIDLSARTKVQEITTDRVATNLRVMDILMNAAGTKLYAVSNFGGLYVYDISNDGATLTPSIVGGGGQVISRSWVSDGYVWHNMWLDESGATPYLYIVSDDAYYAISKWNVSDSTSASLVSRYNGVGDYNDLVYLGNSGSGNTFAVATEDAASELYTFRDNGSGFTQLDSFDPGTFSSPGLIYDGVSLVIVYSTSEANLYEVNVSDPTNISAGISDTSTYNTMNGTWPHHAAQYDTKRGGFFFIEQRASAPYFPIHWISRPETRPTPGSFTYKRKITIDHTKVQDGVHSSFPVLIDETQSSLKHTSFGGNLNNTLGYDLVFTDNTQSTILDHEIEHYSSSTGRLTAWVRIPSLLSDADTDIYMFYGNSTVLSSLERTNSVWDSDYQIVNHLNDFSLSSTTLNRNAKVNANNAFKYSLNSPLEVDSKIGKGAVYDGSYDYQITPNHVDNQQGANDFTVEFWIKPDSTGTAYSCPIYKGNGNDTTGEGWRIRYLQPTTDKLYFHAGTGSVNLGGVLTSSALTENVWTYAAIVVNRLSGYQWYINGTANNSYVINTSAYSMGTTIPVYIGRDWNASGNFFKGGLDEMRVSKTLRTAGWLKTSYNNMNSTSTFYSIASESPAAYYSSPGNIVSSIIDLGSTDQVLTSLNVYQNVPSGCSLSLALEGSNDNSFASYTSESFVDNSVPNFTSSTPVTLNNFRYLRYRVNMTACSNNSQTPSLYSLRLNFR